EESDWVGVCPWGEFSSYKLCIKLRERLEHECARWLKGRGLSGVEVMGSDTAVRIFDRVLDEWKKTEGEVKKPWDERRMVCCLVRPSPKSGVEMDYLRSITAPQVANIGVELILVDSTREPFPLEELSSTAVRELVAKGDWERLRVLRWLHPQVLLAL